MVSRISTYASNEQPSGTLIAKIKEAQFVHTQ